MLFRPAVGIAVALVLSGCATTQPRDSATQPAPAPELSVATELAAPTGPSNADRQAILAMQGEYRVTFDFRETVILAEGYERTKAKESGAYETVVVVADEPGRIVLQHLLVSREGGHVTKHWRQDWFWQAPTRFEFTDEQVWRVRAIPVDKTEGAWTQCVYEVSDAPRYCGSGRWNHKYGVATWTSDRTWRPLPRREYTVRKDYNALNVENRHTVVPGGWTHEQDNTKTQRNADGTSITLAREFGFNDYIRLDAGEFDFSPAYAYWEKSKDYWARVRSLWDERLATGPGLRLDTPVDGMPLIMATFEQADRVIEGGAVSDAELAEVFAKFVKASPAETVTQASH
jgi:hypothetical protein